MGVQVISADVCGKMMEAATRSCHPMISLPPEPANGTADSLAALSTAFTYGSLLLGLIALVGAIAWGFVVKVWAEREAKREAERCTKQWLEEEGVPMLRREMQAWRATFSQESPISTVDLADLVEAAGKEDDNGKE